MRKLLIGLLVLLSFMFVFSNETNAGNTGQCKEVVGYFESQGWLNVEKRGASAFMFVEALIWDKFTYNQKYGMVFCTAVQHNVNKLYIFYLGAKHETEMIGAWDTKKGLRLY